MIENQNLSSPENFLGFATGREELERVLHISQPTQSPTIRQVLLSNNPERGEFWLKHTQTVFAIREFHLIILGSEACSQTPEAEGGVDNIAKIPGGGTIRLRANSETKPIVASLEISGHNFPEYEQVEEIRFALSA